MRFNFKKVYYRRVLTYKYPIVKEQVTCHISNLLIYIDIAMVYYLSVKDIAHYFGDNPIFCGMLLMSNI
jgi:hypothetical protein